MARNYKTGLIATGDAPDDVRAVRLTREESRKFNRATGRSARSERRLRAELEVSRRELVAYVQAIGGAKTLPMGLGAAAGGGGFSAMSFSSATDAKETEALFQALGVNRRELEI